MQWKKYFSSLLLLSLQTSIIRVLQVKTANSSADEIPKCDFFIFWFSEYELPNSTHKKIPAEVYENLIVVKSDLHLNLKITLE